MTLTSTEPAQDFSALLLDSTTPRLPWLQRPQSVFLVIALLFGMLFTFVTPPIQVPDEAAHLFRIWQLSHGVIIGPVHGGYIMQGLGDFNSRYADFVVNKSARVPVSMLWRDLHEPLRGPSKLAGFPNTSLYSPVPYLPQTLGLFVARKLNLSPLLMLYFGRICSVIAYALLGWASIRIMPVLKWPAVAILAAPMSMFMAASLSADPMTIVLGFLATALSLRFILSAERQSISAVVALMLSFVLLALCKGAYFPLVLLVAAIPPRVWPMRRWWILPLLTVLLTVATVFVWSALTHPLDVHELGGDPHQQWNYVLYHPGKYVANFLRTWQRDYENMFYTGLGVMGWLDAPMPIQFLDIFGAAIVWIVLVYDEPLSVPMLARVVSAVAVVGGAFLVLLGNYLVWTQTKARFTEGLQGRYFLPLLLAFLVIFQRRGRYRVSAGWMYLGLSYCLTFALWTLVQRYYLPA